MVNFHIHTYENGVERMSECDPEYFKRKMTIAGKVATEPQKCLIHIAKGHVRMETLNTDGHHHTLRLKERILASAAKDENGAEWTALVYSADDQGADLRYIGSKEMDNFMANKEKVGHLQKELDNLRKELDAARLHYLDIGRRIQSNFK